MKKTLIIFVLYGLSLSFALIFCFYIFKHHDAGDSEGRFSAALARSHFRSNDMSFLYNKNVVFMGNSHIRNLFRCFVDMVSMETVPNTTEGKQDCGKHCFSCYNLERVHNRDYNYTDHLYNTNISFYWVVNWLEPKHKNYKSIEGLQRLKQVQRNADLDNSVLIFNYNRFYNDNRTIGVISDALREDNFKVAMLMVDPFADQGVNDYINEFQVTAGDNLHILDFRGKFRRSIRRDINGRRDRHASGDTLKLMICVSVSLIVSGMTERKEDTTTIIEPDDLLLKFKRNGHFDRQRKHLYESFVNNDLKNDFSQNVTSLCKSIMDSHNGKFTDKLAMQKFLMGKLGEKADLFDSVKAHLKQEMESDNFKEVVNAGLYEAYDQLSAQPKVNETAYTDRIKSDIETPKPKKAKTSKYDLLGDIISGSVRSKDHKLTPSAVVKPFVEHKATPKTESMQIDDKKQPNEESTESNATGDSIVPEVSKPVQEMPEINDDSDLSSAPESETESESDTDSDDEAQEKEKLSLETNQEFAQVFLKGQKLAGFVDDKWHVMIVKSFDKRTGMYLCRMERDNNELSLSFDNLRHFNHVDKELKEGDEVLSLYRLKQGHGLSSVFYPAKIETVRSRILSVHFKDKKETLIMKKNEILQL